ncbi:aminomethyl-transferring glycine dehydrogenase subunit GcvPA [Oscillibacter hominis]|uniref:Aminomethyl-transferring glycine dehydrogenase subunit GcvPA n=1 Tax=Oscillibacter hominis TaxID=2763056 RepID=A0A7G9B365_9FIRM|nr:aminomethyl-transferring glycine dehydrogenase subunit GcvPA [Oscillibacter hominis]QNL43996.1 aminomethyl-transferring glycine dehydrogenase subunit GcvPA [Oscillibacter hominis]
MTQYPYIPNSNEAVRKEMLDFIGAKSVEEIYSFIPDEVRMKRPLDLPKAFTSEMDLKRHMDGILAKDSTCDENISFLGAGCYNHYVPAVCDEINGRSEFLTAYSGDTYADHGKLQTFFEFTSMMGELLDMDVVSFPTYDGGQAASTAIMMSRRINGRSTALVPAAMNPSLLSQLKCYCEGMNLVGVASCPNGQLDLEDLKSKLTDDVACVFIQNPAFLGFFEEQGEEIGKLCHSVGAEYIVYADPSILGIVQPPADYGADIACGEIQPLGIHMSYGGGLGGYLATRQEEKYVMNYPHHLYNIFKNSKGQFGYARALPERTSYYVREKAIEYLGTCVGLWAVTAATYLAVMGPDGMRELGENILYKSNYAQKKLSALPGVKLPYSASHSFMEFVLNFDAAGKTVAEINKALLAKGIFGGYDLSGQMPEQGQSMLVCVTEKTELSDIDALVDALKNIL